MMMWLVESSRHIVDLRSICNELSVVKYKLNEIIGIQLGIPYYKLQELKKEDDPLAATMNYWLCGNVKGASVSWALIVEVLMSSHVDEAGLANRIKKKYGQEDDDGKSEWLQYSHRL